MAITANKPRLLDITRTVSRAGRIATGIDRVEQAYLERFAADNVPAHFICRSSYGYLLLDQAGARAVIQALKTGDWGRPDYMTWNRFRLPRAVRAAQSYCRAHRIDRCTAAGLTKMLTRNMPLGADFYSVGHSNLNVEFLTALRTVEAQGCPMKINIMLHDVIPLDYPETQRPEIVQSFRVKLDNLAVFADRMICISADSRDRILSHMPQTDRVIDVVTAFIGVPMPQPKYAELPEGLDLSRKYFVTIGTIEPRKNHYHLIEVWRKLPLDNRPVLLVIGQRGWLNQPVFDALDANETDIIELNTLSDGAIAALINGSCGLLCPSIAEGFGLPPVEAAALGVPLVCSDLAVFHEILGNIPIYLNPFDISSWKEVIIQLTNDSGVSEGKMPYTPPGWNNHFNVVLGE